MIDTNTLAPVGAGAVAGATTVLLGAQVDALIVGLMAAVFVSFWLETIDSKIKAGAAVLFASMLAAYGSSVASSYLVSVVPSVAGAGDQLRMLLAVLIGGGAPSLFPLVLKYAGKKWGAL